MELDIAQATRELTEYEIIQKSSLAMDLEEIAKNEEISWRQKSWIQWLKQGDKNTKFFHKVANAQRRHNTIDKLTINDSQVDDLNVIKNEILDFSRHLYNELEE